VSEKLIVARGLTKTYGDFIAVDGIFQGGGNVFLANHFLKSKRAVFSGRNNEMLHRRQDSLIH